MCIKKINLNYILPLKRMSLLKRLDFFSLEKIRGKKYRRDDTDKKKDGHFQFISYTLCSSKQNEVNVLYGEMHFYFFYLNAYSIKD